jgi:hypothetical protein
MFDQEREIDPAVQRAADNLKAAYSKLQSSQDPLVKHVERQNVIDTLGKAVTTTMASEMKNSTKPQGTSNN